MIVVAGVLAYLAQWLPGGETAQHEVGVLADGEAPMGQGVVPDELISVPQQRTAGREAQSRVVHVLIARPGGWSASVRWPLGPGTECFGGVVFLG